MNLEELINKYGPDGTIPLFVQGNGHFSGPDGIKGKWKDYEKDQSKILLVADDGTIATCPRMNLVDEQTVESIEYQENRMSGDRYDLDEAYTESFFGWGDNASQQKVLAQYFVPRIVDLRLLLNEKSISFGVHCSNGFSIQTLCGSIPNSLHIEVASFIIGSSS